VAALSLGGTSAWLAIQNEPGVSDADELIMTAPQGIAPTCELINIHDGDTMKLDCGWVENKSSIVTVRLYCIDARELDQEPWGKLARDHLHSITGQVVAIDQVEWDRHGRLVARVYSKGQDLGLRMVADGFAPVYPKYCKDQRYYDAQAVVKPKGLGVWASSGDQQQPWEHRRMSSGTN
jgi:endonuclease YncB( thermonuclease family)